MQTALQKGSRPEWINSCADVRAESLRWGTSLMRGGRQALTVRSVHRFTTLETRTIRVHTRAGRIAISQASRLGLVFEGVAAGSVDGQGGRPASPAEGSATFSSCWDSTDPFRVEWAWVTTRLGQRDNPATGTTRLKVQCY